MNRDTKQQFELSSNRFEQIKPVLSRILCADDIRSVETSTVNGNSDILSALDITGGIDAIAIRNGQMFGIASRICNGDYKTFTVRKERKTTGVKTEYAKKNAQNAGALSPFYTVQAYFQNDKLVRIAMCYTSDLIDYIEQFKDNPQRIQVKTTADKGGAVDFFIVNWQMYAKWYGEKGFRVYPKL